MKNTKDIGLISTIIVVLLGCTPGFIWGILGRYTNFYSENQPPSEIFWHDLVTGIIGTIVGVYIGYLIIRKTLKWINNNSKNIIKTILIIPITFFSGSIAFSLGMGTKELISQLLGWCINCIEGIMLVLLIPAGLVWYTILNIKILGLAAIASGIMSYLFLEFNKK